MRFCEVCGWRLAFNVLPAVTGGKYKDVLICTNCLEELFKQVMSERAGATVQ